LQPELAEPTTTKAEPLFYKRKPTRVAWPALHVRVAARTDRGLVRPNNEDAFVVADLASDGSTPASRELERIEVRAPGVLLAVADGMGGAEHGEIASALAIETLQSALRDAASTGSASPSASRYGVARPALAGARASLEEAFRRAHLAVSTASRDSRTSLTDGTRMGATLTAVLVGAGEALVAQVGDSRAYVLRAGRMAPLTHDQTMLQALLDGGVVTPAEAATSPLRNVLIQAIGHAEELEVPLTRLALRSRDCLLVCSDGLTNLVSEAEIAGVVLSSLNLGVAADRLVALARERGAPDNVTVVLAGVGGDLPPPTEPVASTIEIVTPFVGRLRRR
jgi:serine/threonine protein phosphatase PrpC